MREKEPSKLNMTIEDRLIKEKDEIAVKRQNMRLAKEAEEMNQSWKPNIGDESLRIAANRQRVFTENESLPTDISKWDILYMEGEKTNKNIKKDLRDDEVALMRNSHEYTFQPNTERQESPSMIRSSLDNSTIKKKKSMKAVLD